MRNSPAIAAKHYLQVTDEHFERAIANDGSEEKKAAQQPHAATRKTSQVGSRKTKNPANCGVFRETVAGWDYPNYCLIPPRGVEPLFTG
jgi:hypothetical protein